MAKRLDIHLPHVDDLDRRLLVHLQGNARASTAALARRFKLSGPGLQKRLKKLEDRETPRTGIWDRVIMDTGAPGIYYEDVPELSSFTCPEWSHLSASDSVEFSKRLAPHLRKALQL